MSLIINDIFTANNEITKLELSQCSGDFCTLIKGEELKIRATFVANQDSDKVAIHFSASMGIMELPIDINDRNGCNYINGCPIKKGNTYTFDYSFEIPSFLPDMTADVGIQLNGDNGTLACAIVPGELID